MRLRRRAERPSRLSRLMLVGLVLAAPAGCADGGSGNSAAEQSSSNSEHPAASGAVGQAPDVEAGSVEVGGAQLRAARRAAGIPACTSVDDKAGEAMAEPGLPAVTLPCLGGGAGIHLEDLRGPLVVNVWASWCGPCRTELPHFARLHASGVDVLGIDFQEPRPDQAIELAADSGVGYPAVADVDGRLRAPLRISALPTTLFVDDRGRVTVTLAQQFDSYAELTVAVESQLGVQP